MEQLDLNAVVQHYSQKLAEAQHQIILLQVMVEQLKKGAKDGVQE